uniref:Reverse transcriptase Ty1/copia-type domain-containing protein n=1 Tax=Trichogramma kaykai TaxID=54128 RepID=A0ABD2WHR9_9HYME
MTESKPQDSPMVTRQVKKLELKNPKKVKEMSQPFTGPYREVIGSLLYLAGVTRPDIAYAVNLLSRRQVAPTVGDFQEVKRILRYLRGTTNKGLVYKANESDMEVFTDSSFGDCESSKATSGGQNGHLVHQVGTFKFFATNSSARTREQIKFPEEVSIRARTFT